MREDLINNKINIVDCQSCEYRFRVDSPLIYIDRPRKMAVVSVPHKEGMPDYDDEKFRGVIKKSNPSLAEDIDRLRIQMVLSHSTLVERVFIIEAEMDVRVVEYIKYLIHTRNPEKADPRQKRLLFNAQDSTEEKLVFVVQNMETRALEGVLEYERKAYNAFVEMFDRDNNTPDLFELFPGPLISARDTILEENEDQF